MSAVRSHRPQVGQSFLDETWEASCIDCGWTVPGLGQEDALHACIDHQHDTVGDE